MEVKDGYKMTEIGIIPEDWEVVPLSQITSKIGSGKTPLGGANVYQSEGHVFVRSQNVGWGHYLLDDVVFISDDIHQNQISSELHEGDVLLNITGASIGRSAVVNDSLAGGNVNQHVCIIRLKDKKNSSEYLCYYILSSNIQNLIKEEQAGGSREALNFKQIGAFNITRPESPTEQVAIAEALSDIDSLIASLDKLITKKKNIKQGAMQNLLSGKVRLQGFNDEWVEKALDDVGDFIDGNAFPLKYQGSKSDSIPFYKVSDFNNNNNDNYMLEANNYISYNVASKLNCHILPINAIIYARIGAAISLERKRLATLSCCIDNNMQAFVANQEYESRYILYKTKMLSFWNFANTTALPALKTRDLKQIKLFLPRDKDEQTAIANILFDMDKEIESLQQKRDKYIAIKEGMMQQLLTGKIRLV